MKSPVLLVLAFFCSSLLSSFAQDTVRYADPKKRKIRDFEIVYDSSVGISPGSSVPLGVRLEKRNGSIAMTKGLLNGKMGWGKLVVTVKGGMFINGQVRINQDHQEDEIEVKVYYWNDPYFFKTLSIPLNYKGKVAVYLAGTEGKRGRPGRDGYSTSSGNGTDGEHGEHGGDGMNAPELDVLVELQKNVRDTFLVLDVTNMETYSKRKYKVNIDGGSLMLVAAGGKGGDGGNGGNGGAGTGTGRGGNGGDGGYGGRGGNGAKVTLRFTSEAKPYSDLLTVQNPGGSGGKGGSPGSSGGAGPNRTYQSKTVVGKILEGAGNGTRGNRGANGSAGYSGPPVEIIFIEGGEVTE